MSDATSVRQPIGPDRGLHGPIGTAAPSSAGRVRLTLLGALTNELAATTSDRAAWIGIGQGLLFATATTLLGTGIARRVGLLPADAPAGETFAVGLASGLMVLAAWWAAQASGGRSAFTPVAIGFSVAIAIGVIHPNRPAGDDPPILSEMTGGGKGTERKTLARMNPYIVVAVASALFIVTFALLFGAAMAPSVQNGAQPIQFRDPPFYAVLARSLASTGTESLIPPSGFADVPGMPTQFWYHWAELWLAAAAESVFGATPLAARNFIVLPVVLLAASGIGATIVRRLTNSSSTGSFVFGFLACLLLAPIPLIVAPVVGQVPYLAALPVALVFAINNYGMGAVGALLAMYVVTVLGDRRPTWTLAIFVGSAVAFILPAHVVIAVLALVGAGGMFAVRLVTALLASRHLPAVPSVWRRPLIAAVVLLSATGIWAVLTGHAVPTGSGPPAISPFSADWRFAIAANVVGAGALLAIPIAWFLVRRDKPILAGLYLGTMMLVVAGTIVWGARDADLNMFYFFYAAIGVFAVPLAVVAVLEIRRRLRATGHRLLAASAVGLCCAQLGINFGLGILRVQASGPGADRPVPVAVMTAIANLPAGAKVAYACRPLEEVTYGTPNLLAINAYTGHAIVPMCFEADIFGALLGAELSADRPNGDAWAPQRTLYPDSIAHPSSAQVAAFLKENRIEYIYADPRYPNSLVADAIPITASGAFHLLMVP
jgi:hypothetical protein